MKKIFMLMLVLHSFMNFCADDYFWTKFAAGFAVIGGCTYGIYHYIHGQKSTQLSLEHNDDKEKIVDPREELLLEELLLTDKELDLEEQYREQEQFLVDDKTQVVVEVPVLQLEVQQVQKQNVDQQVEYKDVQDQLKLEVEIKKEEMIHRDLEQGALDRWEQADRAMWDNNI